MIRILFIGTYLSHIRGTKDVNESLAENLISENIILTLKSRFEQKILRILDIIWAIFIYQEQIVHIDVFSGQAFNIALIASKVAMIRNKRILLTLHGGALPEFAKNNQGRIKKLFNRSKYIQTPSQYLRDYFTSLGYKIHYLPNPINLTKFPYLRSVENEHSLLWVRSFHPIYNADLAIKTLFEVKKKYPGCKLTMIGPNKGMLDQAIALVKELGLQACVTFVGAVDNDKLFNYYQSNRVFLNTTSYESFGVSVVEAASCGIPVVSTRVGEIPYLWKHEENMLIVNDFDPKSFANEIFRIFEDQELEQKISSAARTKAEIFNWENIKPTWIKLLRN